MGGGRPRHFHDFAETSVPSGAASLQALKKNLEIRDDLHKDDQDFFETFWPVDYEPYFPKSHGYIAPFR